MLPRNKRLPKAAFGAPGRRFSFPYGSLKTITDPGVAIVVSKKTFKTSVLRHKVKRKILAAVVEIIKKRPVSRGVIIYPTGSAVNAAHTELAKALREVFGRI